VIGRVERGCLRRGATVVRIPESGAPQSFRITKLFGAYGSTAARSSRRWRATSS